MSKSREETPDTWHDYIQPILHAGEDIYYAIVGDGVKVGDKASNVWVWHWHRPVGKEPRWHIAACGLHTVTSVDPLSLVNSLACEDGCPSHGFLTDGIWRPV
jgi:hypothetical protein